MKTTTKQLLKRDRNMILENGPAGRLVSIKILRSLRPLGFLQAREMVDVVLAGGRVSKTIAAAYIRGEKKVKNSLALLAGV